MFENKKILITGGTGFIGYHLTKHLMKNNTVYCLVRSGSDLTKLNKLPKIRFIVYDGNFNTLSVSLKHTEFDIVYHLASFFVAEHKPENLNDILDSNIKFPTQLLETLINNQKHVRLVNTGTSWQNYDNSNYNPVCLYAATKQAFEDIIRFYYEVKSLNCITLRLYDTYGQEDDRKKLFWLLNNLKETGGYLDMSLGEQKLNLVYIDDVITAFILAGKRLLEKDNANDCINEIYGVYANEEHTLKEVVSIFEKTTNCKLNINWGKKSYRNRELMQPRYPHRTLSGWKAKVSLTNGLGKLH